jgi:hypothetical protein
MDPSAPVKAQLLDTFLRRWTQQHPDWARADPYWMGPLRSAEVVAETLLAEAEFVEVGLATWLESPDGQLVRTVVVGLLPPWQRLEADLLVEGVMAAAQARRRNQQGLAAVLTGATVLGLVLFVTGTWRPGLAFGHR